MIYTRRGDQTTTSTPRAKWRSGGTAGSDKPCAATRAAASIDPVAGWSGAGAVAGVMEGGMHGQAPSAESPTRHAGSTQVSPAARQEGSTPGVCLHRSAYTRVISSLVIGAG